jgi:predicted DNA-binding protein
MYMPKKNSPSKPVYSFRISLECVRQLKDLSGAMGRSGGDVVEVSIDRMYREEMRFKNLMINEGQNPEDHYSVEKKG